MTLATRAFLFAALGLTLAAGFTLAQNPPEKNAPAKDAVQAEADATAGDIKTLRDVGQASDGPALLDYFRKHTAPKADPKKIEKLIRQLGAEDFETREEAFANLVTVGAAATPSFKKYEETADAELRKRVDELKRRIVVKAEPPVQCAAARMLARSKPEGAVDVLLAFLPYALDSTVVDDVAKTLGAVGVVAGKAAPALVNALADSAAVKRGAAAEALVRGKASEQLPAVRALLKDADPAVRLRTALALVAHHEKEALPPLIDLIAVLHPEQLWPVEEVLFRLAGDKAPPVSLGSTETSRKLARDAWRRWFNDNQDKVDLARLDNPDVLLGYTVLVHQVINRVGVPGKALRNTEVMEIKPDKSVRWKFDASTLIVDAQVVAEDRVLCAEFQTMQVTERDFKGNILWKKNVGGNPLAVQKLPNGNVFVVKNNGLVELNRQGDEVYTYQPQSQIFRGKKLRNGDVVCITSLGNQSTYTRLDAKNQLVKSFKIDPITYPYGNMDVQPNGNVIVTDMSHQRVVEYDKDGKELKAIGNLLAPVSVQRLANGNTLVSSLSPGRIVEFNPQGAEVMSYQLEGPGTLFNARRR